MKARLVALAVLFYALWVAGIQLPALQRAHEQFLVLRGYLDITYGEIVGLIGPPDVDDDVKGIIEWWSLGKENVAFDFHYPNSENKVNASGVTILFRTWYGHRRCSVDRQTDTGFLSFALFYALDCTGVIKTSSEIAWRDRVYSEKMARLSAQPTPAALSDSQAQ